MKNAVSLLSVPWIWEIVQKILGAPKFKRELYLSRLTPGSTLLDFGCASGHLFDAFEKFNYYGIDINATAISMAKRHADGRRNMHFLVADITDRPFAAEFFDEILFAGTVHHLTDELLRIVFIELHYCLKPGGTVHLLDPVYQAKDGWQSKLMRRIDQGKFTRTLPQILEIVQPLELFSCGQPSYHTPYGPLIQECDFIYLPLTKI